MWQEFGLAKSGDRRVGEAEVDLVWTVPGERFVRPDGVELDPECLGFADEIEWVVDRFEVESLVLQRLEAPLPDPVLARALDSGADVGERRLAGDEGAERNDLNGPLLSVTSVMAGISSPVSTSNSQRSTSWCVSRRSASAIASSTAVGDQCHPNSYLDQ
jgi:hypothetical protein